MQHVPLSSVNPGDTLARELKVRSPQEGVLYKLRLEEGTELTDNRIKRLKKLGISKVPVEREHTDDLDQYMFDPELEEAQDEVLNEYDDIVSSVKNQEGLDDSKFRQFKSTIDRLIETLKSTEAMAAFTTLKTHDDYTSKHSLDVAKISLMLGLEYDSYFRHQMREQTGASRSYVNKNMLRDLGIGAMLHDVGKIDVDRDILQKPDQLSDDEYQKIQEHPSIGYEELQGLNFDLTAPMRVPAKQHHECYDGSGYPAGLSGNDIHLYGRITACADVYSALSSDRPYRDGMTPAKAISIMNEMQEEGPHFDPDILKRFLKIVLPYPIGQEVHLSDNSKGVVCSVDPDNPLQPIVRVTHRGGESLTSPEEIRVNDDKGPRILSDRQELL